MERNLEKNFFSKDSSYFVNDSRIYIYIYIVWLDLVDPGWFIPNTQKMVLDTALPSTQHYKVMIKGKVEQSREWISAFYYASVW